MKKVCITASVILILTLFLGICTSEPIVLAQNNLPPSHLEAVRQQAAGVYSEKLPLIPVLVTVSSFTEEQVRYTIRYFPFGAVGMSYTVGDGYNMEKPLINS